MSERCASTSARSVASTFCTLLGSSVRAPHGLVAVHASADDRIVAGVDPHAQRVATLLDLAPLADLGVLTRHVPEATRTQTRARGAKLVVRAKGPGQRWGRWGSNPQPDGFVPDASVGCG